MIPTTTLDATAVVRPRPTASARPHAVVLLVEDNPGDAELTRVALADSAAIGEIHVVPDGVEALAFLRRDRAYADAPRPDLIMLDLNLPRLDGRRVLADVKQDPWLRDIPVVVLSSSAADDDVATAYRLGANCYVTKAVGLDSYLDGVRAIERFWGTVATLPPERR
jgi:two-component system response regulator